MRCICPVADWSECVVVCVNFDGSCDDWSSWIHIGEFTFFLFFDGLVISVDYCLMQLEILKNSKTLNQQGHQAIRRDEICKFTCINLQAATE